MENTIERCIIISDKDMLDVDDLPQHIRAADKSGYIDQPEQFFTDESIVPFEKIKKKL